MSRKLFGSLTATVTHETQPSVIVSALKTTAYYKNTKSVELFETIHVYRSVEDDFTFGLDYGEYFDGLGVTNADLVFEGPIDEINKRRYTYEDHDVEIGKTYAYWIAGATGDATGPVGVRVRDARVWWPYDEVLRRTEALKDAYPDDVVINTIGRTIQGRELISVQVGNPQPCVAVVGTIHAGEAGPELALGAAEILLANNRDQLRRTGLYIIPSVNVDEREREVRGEPSYLRTNTAGTDLNRNFPADWATVELGYGLDSTDQTSFTYRGPSAASAPETLAVMNALESVSPNAGFAFHCLASIGGMGFITARDADKSYADRCRVLAARYIEGAGFDIDDEKTLGLVCSAGSLPTWCYRSLNVPAFDLEISAAAEPEAYKACRFDHTDVELVSRYQRIHADGLLRVLENLG